MGIDLIRQSTMDVDLIRRAVARLRNTHDHATPLPWTVDPDRWAPSGWEHDVAYKRIVAGEPNPISGIRQPVVSTNGALLNGEADRRNNADAALIVTMVNLGPLLADWLQQITAGAGLDLTYHADEAHAERIARSILEPTLLPDRDEPR